MNPADVIVLAAVIAVAAMAAAILRRNRKNGKSICGCDCGSGKNGCRSSCCGCGRDCGGK